MRPGPAARGAQRGTTLLELMFTLAMFGLLLGVIVRFVSSGRQGMTRQENASEMLKRATLISANLRGGLQTTNLLLCDYTASTPDFSALQAKIRASVLAASGTPKPVSYSSQPTVVEGLKPDMDGPASVSASAWGNEIMYVATLNPVTLTLGYGTLLTSVAEVVSVDRVQLVYVYLSRDPSTKIPGPLLMGGGLRLTEWRSLPLLSYESLNSFNDSPPNSYRRTSACARLLTAYSYSKAFDVSKANNLYLANAFYNLAATTSTAACLSPTAAPATFGQSSWAYLDDFSYQAVFVVNATKNYGQISRQGDGGMSANPSSYAIAFNSTTASASTNTRVNGLIVPGAGMAGLSVPGYAQVDGGGSLVGFPGGFEVAVYGGPHARMFVARTVLMAASGAYPKFGPGVYAGYEKLTFINIDNAY